MSDNIPAYDGEYLLFFSSHSYLLLMSTTNVYEWSTTMPFATPVTILIYVTQLISSIFKMLLLSLLLFSAASSAATNPKVQFLGSNSNSIRASERRLQKHDREYISSRSNASRRNFDTLSNEHGEDPTAVCETGTSAAKYVLEEHDNNLKVRAPAPGSPIWGPDTSSSSFLHSGHDYYSDSTSAGGLLRDVSCLMSANTANPQTCFDYCRAQYPIRFPTASSINQGSVFPYARIEGKCVSFLLLLDFNR